MQPRGPNGCPSGRTGYQVPSNGHSSEGKWQTTTHNGHAGAQQTCCPRNTPQSIPLSPGNTYAWNGILQCANLRGRSPPHYVHDAMGSVPIQSLTTRLRCVTGRVRQQIRGDCQ